MVRPGSHLVLRAGGMQPGAFPAVWRSPRLGGSARLDPTGTFWPPVCCGGNGAMKVAYALGLLLHLHKPHLNPAHSRPLK